MFFIVIMKADALQHLPHVHCRLRVAVMIIIKSRSRVSELFFFSTPVRTEQADCASRNSERQILPSVCPQAAVASGKASAPRTAPPSRHETQPSIESGALRGPISK